MITLNNTGRFLSNYLIIQIFLNFIDITILNSNNFTKSYG